MEISRLVGQKTERQDNTADVGGICGYNNGTPMEACINNGDIDVEYNMTIHLGGISGYNDSREGSVVSIKDSSKNGKVKGKATEKNIYIGGISGYSEELSTIENSTNNGTVEGQALKGTLYQDDSVGYVE